MTELEIPEPVAAYAAGLATAGIAPADIVSWIAAAGLGTWPGQPLLDAADRWLQVNVSQEIRDAIERMGPHG